MAILREFVQLTKESAYKTPVANPARGTDQIVIRLDQANAFGMRAKPLTTKVPYGGGRAVNDYTVSDQMELKGGLNTILCYSQAALLLGWLATPIPTSQDAPWTTTEPVGDLASVTIDHAVFRDDNGTYKRTRYLGVKCLSGKLDCSRDNRIARLALELQGSTHQSNPFDGSADPDATAFPVPADGEFPADPVLFLHAAGRLTIGAARTQFSSIGVSITNKVDPRWYEFRFVNTLRALGRDSMLTVDAKLKGSVNDRLTYEQQQAIAVSIGFSNGINTITLNYHGSNVIDADDDSLALDKVYDEKLSVANYWDTATHEDLVFAFA